VKHTSLLERAAEAYDFDLLLRGKHQPVARTAGTAEQKSQPAFQTPPEQEPLPTAEALSPEPAAGQVDPPQETPAQAPVRVRSAAAEPPQPAPGPVLRINRERLAEAGYIVPEAPVSGLAEEFRIIKRQLLADMDAMRAVPDERRRTVLIASAQAGEGKSWCALNLALSLANEREREVLLVDGDLMKPELFARLGAASDGPGLVDALADPALDPAALVRPTELPRLSLLGPGRKVSNAPELLHSDQLARVIERLARTDPRRIILFDSPPALLASHASILAADVGQVLMVVRADRTVEADLREAAALLSACDRISLVLNGAAMSAGGRRFGSYRGYAHDE